MAWRRTPLLVAAALLLGSTGPALPGQTLQHRKPSPDGAAAAGQPAPPAPGIADAGEAVPPAAEGEYRWGETGEVIELYVEGKALHGYMTRRSDRGNPDSSPLTFQFKEAATTDGGLSFSTTRIHGDWYSFIGRVLRGTATNPREDGYYLLSGTLITHLGAGSAAEGVVGQPTGGGGLGADAVSRQVTLKQTGSRAEPAR